MRKKKTEKVEQIVEEVVSETITCNKCGNSVTQEQRGFESDYYQNINLHFGYGSSFDMETWNFDICEDCLVEFVKTFKHVPSGFRSDEYLVIDDESKEHQKLFENWKETGKWDELKYKTYEELVGLKGIYKEEYIDPLIREKFDKR